MALKGRMDKAAFNKMADQVRNNALDVSFDILEYLGNECVREARTNGNYQNITANLRNSVGFVVMYNGQVVRENFQRSASAIKPSDLNPIATGKSLAVEVGSKTTGKPVLVVVAGMNYASYVEATGRNVLTSAEQLAKRELPKLVEEIFS